MVKKICVFITILGLFFLGIPQFNSKASTVLPGDASQVTIGSIIYQEKSNIEYELYFDLAFNNTSSKNLYDVLNVNGTVIYSVRQPNISYEYELYAENHALTEVMPIFDTILFRSDYDDVLIFSNGEVVKSYNTTNFDVGYIMLTLAPGDDEYQQGWDDGYDVGYGVAKNQWYDIGYDYGLNDGYDSYTAAYADGYIYGLNLGYNQGLNETDATGFIGLLGAVFTGLGSLLSIEILPNIYIGAIIAVPLVFGIIFFILGKRKGD